MNFSTFFLDKLNSNNNHVIGLGLKNQNLSGYGFADIIKVCESETASNTSQANYPQLDFTTNEIDSLADNTLVASESNLSELSQIINQFISNPDHVILPKEITQNLDSTVVNKKQFVLSQNELQNFITELVGILPDASAVTSNIDKGNSISGTNLSGNKEAIVQTLLNSLKQNNMLNLTFKSSAQKLSINVSSLTGNVSVEINSEGSTDTVADAENESNKEQANNAVQNTDTIPTAADEQKLYKTEVIQISLGNVTQEKAECYAGSSNESSDSITTGVPLKYQTIANSFDEVAKKYQAESSKLSVEQGTETKPTDELIKDAMQSQGNSQNINENADSSQKIVASFIKEMKAGETGTSKLANVSGQQTEINKGSEQKALIDELNAISSKPINNENQSVTEEVSVAKPAVQSVKANTFSSEINEAGNNSQNVLSSREYKTTNSLSEMTKIVEQTTKTTESAAADKNTFTIDIDITASKSTTNIQSADKAAATKNKMFTSSTEAQVSSSELTSSVDNASIQQSAKEISEVTKIFSQGKMNNFEPDSLGGQKINEKVSDTLNSVSSQPKSFETKITNDSGSAGIVVENKVQDMKLTMESDNTNSSSAVPDSVKSTKTEQASNPSFVADNKEAVAFESNTHNIKVTAEEKKADQPKQNVASTNIDKSFNSAALNDSSDAKKVNGNKVNGESNNVSIGKKEDSDGQSVVKEAQSKSSDGSDLLKQSSQEKFSDTLLHSTNGLKENNVEQVKNLVETKGFEGTAKTIKASEIISEFSKFVQNSGDKQSVTFQLTPDNLGKVKLVVDLVQNQVNTRIEVENEQVRQFIQQNIDQLKTNLQSSGIQLNSVNISLANYEQKNGQQKTSSRKYTAKVTRIKEEQAETKERTRLMGYNTYEFLA